tara:strand:+ start:362 stop:718 length:357 start_codon:yes stop_codon:yes gene_type:complete
MSNKQTPIEKAIDLIDGFLTELDDIAENNNKQSSVEWLAKSYVDLLTELNDDKISLKEFEIKYIEILEQSKEKYEHEMCVFADEYASYVLEQSKPGIKGAMVSMCAWTFFKNRRNEQQ